MARFSMGLLVAAKFIVKAGGVFGTFICLGFMLLLLITDPFMRYLVGKPFFWSNEVTTYLMILMSYLTFGMAFARGMHVRVTLIFAKLSQKVQNVLWIITSIILIGYVCTVAYGITRLAISSFSINSRTPTAEMPFLPWQILVLIGMLIFVVAIVLFTIKRVYIARGIRRDDLDVVQTTEQQMY